MSNLIDLTPQTINSIFESFAKDKDSTFWICNFDYSQQIYLSPSFKDIWQVEPALVYDNMQLLMQKVVKEDLESAVTLLTAQHQRIKTNYGSVTGETYLYRLQQDNGELTWIKDKNFIVHNRKGQPVAMAGVCTPIPSEEWLLYKRKQYDTSQQQSHLDLDFVELIERHCTPYIESVPESPNLKRGASHTLEIDQKSYRISWRELQCIAYMVLGASAKQTAKALHLSPRTVESYIDQLKIKFACHSKLVLIAKLGQNPLILSLLGNPQYLKL